MTETDTGKTWINGEKIYRKCFNIPSIQPGVITSLDANLTTITPITYYGYLWAGGLVVTLPALNLSGTQYQIQFYQNRSTGPTLTVGSGYTELGVTSLYGVVCIEYIKV